MEFSRTKIPGLIIIKPKKFEDDRGYFYESFNQDNFEKNICKINFLQDNESKSSFGVIRGLHFQVPPFDQAKLVRCIKGEVIDIAVDLRKNSPTYGHHEKFILSEYNSHQLFIPRGFAHGFIVKSESAIFSYKVDNKYSKNHEGGIHWNDSYLNIDWEIDESKIITSDKDCLLGKFKDFDSPFQNYF